MDKKFHPEKCKDVVWEGRADCQGCSIRGSVVLAGVDLALYENLLTSIMKFCYPGKTVLYNEGVKANYLYTVRKGLVKLEDTLEDGSVRIVRLIKQGQIVGLETLLDHEQRYEQTAVTIHETEVCRIPYRTFHSILEQDPGFIDAVMEQWHKQLEASEQVIVEFSTGTLRQRLAHILLLLVEDANHNHLVEVQMIPIEDIAALAGVTKESVSRILAEFKRNQVVIKSGPNRVRLNEEALRKMTEM
ncbi:MAG: Crp/Fnr family transcriptional regulator [uncultured Thiotrichaceae bacterium]|uniref:Crp/Fnr family transcriptional regulator n=1 Tax=uncultured Thiotrichaceae bacterium TaxID=298394 RepID=A0A6S6TZ49_9GAMM|nr:MAG: Crp/Fnr family transcriptional regulator [uncultured Thiotrichaceae bacterium]